MINFLTVSFYYFIRYLINQSFSCKIIRRDHEKPFQTMMMFSQMEGEATTSQTCRKVYKFPKPTNVSKKSKGNTIHPIVGKESPSSVSKRVILTTKKTTTVRQPTSKPNSPISHTKAVKLASKSPKPFPTQGRVFSTTHPRLQKVTWVADWPVKSNHLIQGNQLTSFTQTKTRNSFLREWKKWSNRCFMVIILPSNQKWRLLSSTQHDNQEPLRDFTTQIKLSRRTG